MWQLGNLVGTDEKSLCRGFSLGLRVLCRLLARQGATRLRVLLQDLFASWESWDLLRRSPGRNVKTRGLSALASTPSSTGVLGQSQSAVSQPHVPGDVVEHPVSWRRSSGRARGIWCRATR